MYVHKTSCSWWFSQAKVKQRTNQSIWFCLFVLKEVNKCSSHFRRTCCALRSWVVHATGLYFREKKKISLVRLLGNLPYTMFLKMDSTCFSIYANNTFRDALFWSKKTHQPSTLQNMLMPKTMIILHFSKGRHFILTPPPFYSYPSLNHLRSRDSSCLQQPPKELFFKVNTNSVRTRIRKKGWVGVFPLPWI